MNLEEGEMVEQKAKLENDLSPVFRVLYSSVPRESRHCSPEGQDVREHLQTIAREWEDGWPQSRTHSPGCLPCPLGWVGGDWHRFSGQEGTSHESWRVMELWEDRKVGSIISTKGENISKVGEVGTWKIHPGNTNKWILWWGAGSRYEKSPHHGLCP